MTRMVRVFVNAAGVDVPVGATAIDAVRAWDAAAADELQVGRRLLTDSRGLPLSPDAPMSAGSIVRLIAKRDRDAGDPVDGDA